MRVLGAFAGLLVRGAGASASLFAALLVAMSAHRPDPEVPDGDPCCAHPDT